MRNAPLKPKLFLTPGLALLICLFSAPASATDIPSSLAKFLHYWISPYLVMEGGNISGGGEGYRVGNASQCKIAGVQLVDFARPQNPYLDRFEDLKSEPLLFRGRFDEASALEGVEVNLPEVAALSWSRAHRTLDKWEKNSPITVRIARARLAKLKWFATPLAMSVKLDNLAVGMNFPRYYAPWTECANYKQEYFGKWEGTVASFVRGKGVFLSSRLWSRMGDNSRAGLLVHESLRSAEYDEDIPLRDEQIRDVVNAMFRENPEQAKPGHLDNLLLDLFPMTFFEMPYTTKREAEPLSLACGINFPTSKPFAKDHRASIASYYKSVVAALPVMPGKKLVPGKNVSETLARIRMSAVTEKILKLAGKEVAPRIRKMKWYNGSEISPASAFEWMSSELVRRIERDCDRFRYSTRAHSLEPPMAVHDLLNLQKMVSLSLQQLAQEGLITLPSAKVLYSPEFALPTVHKTVKAFRLADHHLGILPEVIEAVGGQRSFDKINSTYDKWYWNRKDDPRHVLYLMSETLPWPKSYEGLETFQFLRKWDDSGLYGR